MDVDTRQWLVIALLSIGQTILGLSAWAHMNRKGHDGRN